jgi:hypothetical protein
MGFLAEFQKQFHGFGKGFSCQLAAFDNEANILLVDLVVIYNIESHPFVTQKAEGQPRLTRLFRQGSFAPLVQPPARSRWI